MGSATSAFSICLEIIVILFLVIITIFSYRVLDKKLPRYYKEFKYVSLALLLFSLVLLVDGSVKTEILDIIECLTFPEKVIYDYFITVNKPV